MADEVDEIRTRIDIVDLVESSGIVLRRTGRDFKGLCPFHSDRNPSFSVNQTLGRYRCWSCGEKGDIFNWVMKTQNVDFGDALAILAQKAGVTLTKRGPADTPETRSARQRQFQAMEAALTFFRAELPKSPQARAYCERRRLDEASLKSWQLGYAPDIGEALVAQLKKAGTSLAEAKELFLVDGDAQNGFGDKFKGRLMFPIRDERGDLVAFGGRLLGDGVPKYINSSDTPLYRKSRVLYGMWESRDRLRKDRTAVLVEGYLDVIACHQAGVNNALASLGTSLAEDQARLLKRWCDDVTILYDGDSAGVKAADRAIDILQAEGIRVKVASLPAGEDPDTILHRDGAIALQKVVERAVLPLDFRVAHLKSDKTATDPAFWEEAFAILAAAPSELELVRQIEHLAPLYPEIRDIHEAKKALRSEVKRRQGAKGRVGGKAPTTVAQAPIVKLDSAELLVFHAYLEEFERPRLHALFGDREFFITGNGARGAEGIVKEFGAEPPVGPPALWLHRLDAAVADFLSALDFRRFGALNSQLLEDAIQKLQKKRANRLGKLEETSDDRLIRAQARLLSQKGDHNPGREL